MLLFYFVSSFIIRLFYTTVLCVSNILFLGGSDLGIDNIEIGLELKLTMFETNVI